MILYKHLFEVYTFDNTRNFYSKPSKLNFL